MERGDAGHASDARRHHRALGDLDLADAPPALELHHARAAGDGERAHEKIEPVVLEQPDDAAVVAILAHRHRQPRQRQHVANERRPRDELVDAGAQRLFAPIALADGDHRQLARRRLFAQPPDDRQRLRRRRRRRPRAAARASAPWPPRLRRRASRRPCNPRARSRRPGRRRSYRRRRERPMTRGAPRAAEYTTQSPPMITLEVLAGDNDRRHLRARPAGADARPRARQSGGAYPTITCQVSTGRSSARTTAISIRDLKSTNGSRVQRGGGEISLDDGTHETILVDGDELLLGDPQRRWSCAAASRSRTTGAVTQEIIAQARSRRSCPRSRARSSATRCARRRCTTWPRSWGGAGSTWRRCSTASAEAIFELLRRRPATSPSTWRRSDGRMNTASTPRALSATAGERVHISRSIVRHVQREKRRARHPTSRPRSAPSRSQRRQVARRHHRRAVVGRRDHSRRHPGRQARRGVFLEQRSRPRHGGGRPGDAGDRERAPGAAAAGSPRRSCAAK